MSQQVDIEMYRQIGTHGISQMIKQQTLKAQNSEMLEKPLDFEQPEPINLCIKQNFPNNINLLSGEGTIGVGKSRVKKTRKVID